MTPRLKGMKTNFLRLIAAGLIATFGVSCSTAYDAYGRPISVVDPGMAALGVAAAGIAGYAIANNNNRSYRGHGYNRGYSNYRGYGSHRGYSNYSNRRYYSHTSSRGYGYGGRYW
jgi:hypothetical protein